MEQYPVIIVVGRFQLPHKPHLHLLKTALEKSSGQVIVILGSAFHARTIKNCFTWQEREQMLRLCLTDEENAKTSFIPVRDYYDNKIWYADVSAKVHTAVQIHDHDIRVVGFFKDASSAYLSQMPWEVIDAGSPMEINSTTLRSMLFESEDIKSTLAAMSSYVPVQILNYLKAWSSLPFLQDLKDEYSKIQKENRSYGAKYGLTADFIIKFTVTQYNENEDYVLLVKRGRCPGKGLMATPGGFYEPTLNETLFQCGLRETHEETQHNIWEPKLRAAFKERQFFDAPERSVRKNIMTMAHFFELDGPELPSIKGSVDPGESYPVWVKVSEIANMENIFFDDHFMILHYFLKFNLNHMNTLSI
jgi:bifunctional NMN adenylyltransferase/nudix hydrolase